MPPTQRPLRLEAAILSRMRSEVTSRSNWANDSSTFNVNLPMDVVVLNCWVTDTKDTLCWSNSSTSFAKSANERVRLERAKILRTARQATERILTIKRIA